MRALSLPWCSLLLSALLALGTPAVASAATLTVAVAANVQYAFDEIAAAFTRETGHAVKPVYNSSGKFTAQIMHGAPFDVFLSADMAYPEKLHAAGLTTAAPRIYGYGALVLWTLKDLDLTQWQRTLAGSQVKKIAVANPATAPYGRETMQALTALKLETALRPKLVFGESISQTNQYIHSRVADAGFTAKSVVVSPQMQGRGRWLELPRSAYAPIAQGVVILKQGQTQAPEASRQFHDFLFSPPARAILDRYGYLLP